MKQMNNGGGGQGLRLSGRELCVAGGFLDVPVLYGVESGLFSNWRQGIGRTVHDTVGQLERRGLLSCRMDGRVRIREPLYRSLMCMAFPQWLLWHRRRTASGEQTESFLFGNKECCTVLKPDGNGHYRVQLIRDKQEMIHILDIFEFPGTAQDAGAETPFQETIPMEVLREAKAMAEAFDAAGAEELIAEQLSDHSGERAQMLIDMLNGAFCFDSWNLWQWSDGKLKKSDGGCWGTWKDRTYSLSADEDVLQLEICRTAAVRQKIMDVISGGEA